MAVTQAIPITRHPYADGSYKKMLIDGKWVDAASGKKFETHQSGDRRIARDRRRGRCRGHQSRGRRRPPRLRGTVEQGQAVRAAEPAAQARRSRREEFRGTVAARHARHGRADQPHPRQQAARARHAALLRGAGDRDPWRDHRELAARRDLLLHAEGAGRRRRRDHSLERPAGRQRLEDRPRDRDRLHGGAEAGRGSAADLAAAG